MDYYHKPNPKYDKITKVAARLIFGGLVVIAVSILELFVLLHSPNLGSQVYRWVEAGTFLSWSVFWFVFMIAPCLAGFYAILFPDKIAKLGRTGHTF